MIASIIFVGLAQIIIPTYRGAFKILINDPITKKSFYNEKLQRPGELVFDLAARSSDVLSNDIPTLLEYLKSEAILIPVLDKFNISYDDLNSKLSVNVIDNPKDFDKPAQVLYVSLKYKNKETGYEILNSIADLYLDTSLEMRKMRLSEGIAFLDSQEPELKKNAEILRNELSFFREKNSLLDPKEEAITLKKRLNNLDDKILKLKTEEENLKKIEKEIRKGKVVSSGFEMSEKTMDDGESNSSAGLFITDSNQSILKELIELKKLYASYLTKYLPSSDLVKGLQDRISFLEPLVLEKQLDSVKAAIDFKSGSIEALKKQKEELNKVFLKQPKFIAKYEELVNKLDLANEKEKALVRAKENFRLEITQRNIPWIILKKPFFEKKPINKKQTLLYLTLGSIAFGFLIIFLKDKEENYFNDSKLVSKLFDEKIIAEIPLLKNLPDGQSLETKFGYLLNYDFKIDKKEDLEFIQINYKELFRNLYTNFKIYFSDKKEDLEFIQIDYKELLRNLYTNLKIYFSNIKQENNSFPIDSKELVRDLYANFNFYLSNTKIKIVSFNSSISGEGKSFLSTLIGKIYSYYDFKVLILDANLRNPNIHKCFNLDNDLGLTNLISEKFIDIQKYKKIISKNLEVITSGPTDLDPIKILSSKNMELLLESLKKSNEYDLVIIDNAAGYNFSDYKIISKYIDGLIFLISIGFCNKEYVQKTYYDIKKLELNLLGIIPNFVD